MLGPRHSTAALQSTIAEPWMSTVKADAAKAKEAGWFWQFTINSVKARASRRPSAWRACISTLMSIHACTQMRSFRKVKLLFEHQAAKDDVLIMVTHLTGCMEAGDRPQYHCDYLLQNLHCRELANFIPLLCRC